MRELGYVEGKNLVIEWRFADGKTERMPGFAAEFVQLKVDAIVAVDAVGISAAQKAGGLIVLRDGFLNQQRRQIAELAAKNRLPTIAGLREFVEAGGLMSYGNSLADQYRRVATYVGKILKGAKPANLPVEQPTKFELFINRKTAKALGLTIPASLLISADKVID